MKSIIITGFLSLALTMAGCKEAIVQVDTTPPAPPQGIAAFAGDNQVNLVWYPSQAEDVAGYNIFVSTSYDGKYSLIASTTGTGFVDRGATNGTTYYYAVSAYDRAKNESRLSREDVHATPRPEGAEMSLKEYHAYPDVAGYDFSSNSVGPYNDQYTDFFFEYSSGTYYLDVWNDSNIQDMGYTSSLDEISRVPLAGWSPSKDVRLIVGHTYAIETWDHHYAKVRIAGLEPTIVTFDWAYQMQAGNPFLKQGIQTTREPLRFGSGVTVRQ
ncbi:MAG: hypothetical protein HY033_05185 [Ignavibacteriae bacterium]|nr:hypothetical protein [Ignavibacteria bacterium]MBI3364283.1 hypothetical protein [Ignavibacteriota bacterium]